MKSLYIFTVAVLASVFSYAAAYALVDKPLTLGELDGLYQKKMKILQEPGVGKIYILAGSNGRFSHSCAVIEAELKRKCGNLSLAAGVGIDFVLSSYAPGFKRGDVVYMPLEYEQYTQNKQQMMSGPENPLLMKKYQRLLWSLGVERVAHALLYPDLRYFVEGVSEMALKKRGVKRRFDENSINSNGDQVGHDARNALPYRKFVMSQKVRVPGLTEALIGSDSSQFIARFLREMHARGVIVVGGLPTLYGDVNVSDQVVNNLRSFYESKGQKFLVLDNKSQYDRSCFYDISYHLIQPWQIYHSRLLSIKLKSYI